MPCRRLAAAGLRGRRCGAKGALVPTLPYNRYAVGCAMPENNSTLRNLVNLAIAQMVQGYVNGVPRYPGSWSTAGWGQTVPGAAGRDDQGLLPDRPAQPRTDPAFPPPPDTPCHRSSRRPAPSFFPADPAPLLLLVPCGLAAPGRHRLALATLPPSGHGGGGPSGSDHPGAARNRHAAAAARLSPIPSWTAGFVNGRPRPGRRRGPTGRLCQQPRLLRRQPQLREWRRWLSGWWLRQCGPYGRSFVNW